MVAVLGLDKLFTHERIIVVSCVSCDGVAMLSPLWGGMSITNNGILKLNSSIFPRSEGYIHSTLPREYTD